jgi:hypothetical protein
MHGGLRMHLCEYMARLSYGTASLAAAVAVAAAADDGACSDGAMLTMIPSKQLP